MNDAPHDYQRYTALGLKHVIARAGLVCADPVARNTGFHAVALLAAIACAESVLGATRTRRWRLILAPILILCVPIINGFGWLFGWVGGSGMIASGHSIEVRKP